MVKYDLFENYGNQNDDDVSLNDDVSYLEYDGLGLHFLWYDQSYYFVI